jgi:hypothetical protein
MDMVRHEVPFNNPTFFLPSPLMKDGPECLTNMPTQGFTTPFGHEDDMILAISPGMGQALIGFRHGVLLGGLIKPRGENSTPGTLKAVQVTLVKPVAYLKYRVKCQSYQRQVSLKITRATSLEMCRESHGKNHRAVGR